MQCAWLRNRGSSVAGLLDGRSAWHRTSSQIPVESFHAVPSAHIRMRRRGAPLVPHPIPENETFKEEEGELAGHQLGWYAGHHESYQPQLQKWEEPLREPAAWQLDPWMQQHPQQPQPQQQRRRQRQQQQEYAEWRPPEKEPGPHVQRQEQGRGVWGALMAGLQPLTTLNASAALCMALMAAAVAMSSYGFVGVLLMLRTLAPPRAINVPLHFDYSTPTATALVQVAQPYYPARTASVVTELLDSPVPGSWGTPPSGVGAGTGAGAGAGGVAGGAGGAAPGVGAGPVRSARVGRRGEQPYRLEGEVQVEVQLELPPHGELFQLSGELLTAGGRAAARSTATYVPKARPWLWQLMRYTWLAPCYAIGTCSDMLSVRLPLFQGQVLRPLPSDPITSFRATLTSRAAAAGLMAPPVVHKARVRLAPKTGLLKRSVYWLLRPSLPLALSLGSLAVALGVGSGMVCVGFGVAAVVLYWLSCKMAARGVVYEALANGAEEEVVVEPQEVEEEGEGEEEEGLYADVLGQLKEEELDEGEDVEHWDRY